MPLFSIASLTENDIPAVMRIISESNLSRWSENDLREELCLDEAIIFKLTDKTRDCLGFVFGRIVPGFIRDRDAELYNIGLSLSERRKGGGSLLMEKFIEEAIFRGAKNIWLDVRASNHPAISLYEKFGFVEDGIRKGFYSDPIENAVLMRLELSK